MCPANDRWCFSVISFFFGWAHTQNDLWNLLLLHTAVTKGSVILYNSKFSPQWIPHRSPISIWIPYSVNVTILFHVDNNSATDPPVAIVNRLHNLEPQIWVYLCVCKYHYILTMVRRGNIQATFAPILVRWTQRELNWQCMCFNKPYWIELNTVNFSSKHS